MDNIYLLLPLVFAVVGWATEYWELYAMAGVLGFYASYSMIADGSLTNQVMTLVLLYLVFSVSIFMRIVHETTRGR